MIASPYKCIAGSIFLAVAALALQYLQGAPWVTVDVVIRHGKVWIGFLMLISGLCMGVWSKICDDSGSPLVLMGSAVGVLANLGGMMVLLPNMR